MDKLTFHLLKGGKITVEKQRIVSFFALKKGSVLVVLNDDLKQEQYDVYETCSRIQSMLKA